jgi:hypothetical protein
MNKQGIRELVNIALTAGHNQHIEFSFSVLSRKQAKILKQFIQVDLTGVGVLLTATLFDTL